MVKVSVIIPCYNGGEFLPETVDSVLAQTYSDYELIIVDDGSNDGKSPAICKQQATRDKRIKALTHPKNKGLPATRNTAINAATGEYILPLDSDDKIDPTFLEKAYALIEAEKADGVYVDYQCFGDASHICKMIKNPEVVKKKLPFQNCFPPTFLYRKSCWQEFGGYDESLPAREDWDFAMNFAEYDKKLVHLNEVLFFHRKYMGSLSTQTRSLNPQINAKIRQNHASLYRLRNYYLTVNYLKFVVRRKIIRFSVRKNRRYLQVFGIYIIKPIC